uniref:RNA-directed DNA polymerase n=1 Tax=Strongyloides venezuelensis TaxID=75913 RepID=A0A0K0FGL0_STRVS
MNLLLTPKQDGNYRCCLDCRPLNKAIRNFDFRMPVIRDKVELLSNDKYYSVIDLIQYFNQIELQDDDKQLFGFRDSEGIPYVFKRLLFGVKTGIAIAQAVINQILEECLKFCFSYIDDIIIMSKNSLEEHYEHIEKVLQALKKANLKVNKRKSVFDATQVNFIGFTFCQNGMVPNNYALETLDRMPPPQSLKSLRRYLGKINFYRNHLPNLSKIELPMLDLLKKGKEFNWTVECQKAYDDVKLLLKNACRLSLPDFSLPFQLYTDASGDCFGSALMQKRKNKDGKETMVPLGFYSRRNPLRVTFQPAVKLELQCICESMKHFRQWVAGGFTIIHTDHLPLVKLVEKNSDPNIFRYGERNVVADCISRMYLRRTTEEKDNSKKRNETLPKDNVVFRNKKKSRVKKMPTMKKLEKNVNVQKIVLDGKNVESLEMEKNEPTEDEKLKKNWKTLRKDLKSYLTRCQTCLKRNQTFKTCDVEKSVYASRPWEVVNIDVLGPLQVDEYEMKHIVGIIDLNTKYLILESVPDFTTNKILGALERSLFFKYGAPERIRTDNAPYLKADVMKTITKEYGSVIDYGTPYLHTSSTHIERAFRTIENQLSKEANGSYTGWSKLVPQIAFHYNCMTHGTIKKLLFKMMHGFNPLFKYDFEKNKDKILNVSDQDTGPYAREKSFQLARLTAEAIHEENRDKFVMKYTPGYVITGCKENSFFIKKAHLRGRPKLVHRDHIKVDTSIHKKNEKVKVGKVNSV